MKIRHLLGTITATGAIAVVTALAWIFHRGDGIRSLITVPGF
jgi:hypothetical protein